MAPLHHLITHATQRASDNPVRHVRAVAVVVLALVASAGCERITAPTGLAYADRAIIAPVTATGWRSVAVGGSHSCGIRTNGALYCWGGNAAGQLGVGVARGRCGRFGNPCEAGPRAASTAERFLTVSAGLRHSCAITERRALYCWGESLTFQTGVEGVSRVDTPTPVMPALQFIDVGAGMSHSCAVRTNGVVYCWGEGWLGALGRGDTVTSVIPAPIASTERFVSVSSGRLRSCAIALDGAAWCWGAEWESTDGSFDFYHSRLLPHRVEGLPPLRHIAVGITSICAVTLDGAGYCWESNAFAQLGTGTLTSTATPSPIATREPLATVTTGIIQTCGTTLAGRVLCWGNNSFGQLGVPRSGEFCGAAALECSRAPIAVFGGLRFVGVATGGGNHTCGVTAETALLCWGLGSEGQLGDGFTRDRQSLPVGVLAPVP